jgi:hypothetical protein
LESDVIERQVGTEPTTSAQGLQTAEICYAVSILNPFVDSPDGHRSESGASSEMSPGVESEGISQKLCMKNTSYFSPVMEHLDLTWPSSQETYVKMLLPRCHGYPLWFPEPDNNLPDAYRTQGVRVGDLGYVSDSGGFEYIFNILEPADHGINLGRTPENFEQLSPPLDMAREITSRDMMQPDTDICSVKIKKSVISWDDIEATTP